MGDLHGNVDHISDITKSSPYLFFSLILLTYNIFFTSFGVQANEGDPLEGNTVQYKAVLYYVSLFFFPIICASILIGKCVFINRLTKPPHLKLIVSGIYDSIFVIMGTLYLAGDNRPILICSGMNSTTDKDTCLGQSSVIVGVSLLLHTTLYVASALELKPTEVTAFPVTGRIRKAYQTVLQLVAFTIILDQTFSTMVRLITHIDIEIDERPNCGSTQMEVEGFLAGLFIIMLPVILGLLVMKNWKDYCSCCWIKRKSMIRQCCCHLWESILIFISYCSVIGFMAIYTLADNRWLWVCTPVSMSDSTMARFGMLFISLSLNFIWVALYLVVFCLPGVGIVWKKNFATENDYMSVLAEKEKHKWVCKNATVKKKDSADIDLTSSNHNMAIEENYGSVSIALPIEDITWWQGVCYFLQGCRDKLDKCCPRCRKCTQCLSGIRCKCCSTCCAQFCMCQCSCVEDITCASCLQNTMRRWWKRLKKRLGKEEDTATAEGGEGNVTAEGGEGIVTAEDGEGIVTAEGGEGIVTAEGGEGIVTAEGGEGIVTAEGGQDTATAAAGEMETADEEMIMFTYLGKKKNFTSATLSQDGTLQMNNGQKHKHPPGTQFYMILKQEVHSSKNTASILASQTHQNVTEYGTL